jgi:hypothetical protein
MRLRVCILARESLLSWPCYFLNAFREECEVISIGAATRRENHNFPDWSAVEQYVVRNDINSDELDAVKLMELLPEGWTPDLVVVIQSGAGIITGITELGCPTVYLSIDTWHDPREFVHAHQYDFVFLAQKGMVKYMRKAGCCRAFWLPLGCDPRFHFAAEGEEKFDIGFVGSTHFMVNRQRVARLKVLEEHFNLGFTFGLGCADMAQAYAQTRLIFNASIAKDVNMRVFEALATGKPLVTNHEAEANGLFDLFEDEKHLITYTDENLIAQVQRCLDNPEWAAAIGAAGRREVLEKHTYAHRVREMLHQLQEYMPDLGQRTTARFKPGKRVAEFVPNGTRRLLDVGMGLDTSRVALHRQGVRHVAAIAMSPEALEQRGKSYDAATLFTGEFAAPDEPYDAILWSDPLAHGIDVERALETSKALMVEGGRVILLFQEGELAALVEELSFSSLYRWLLPLGYKLLVWRSGTAESDFNLISACQISCLTDEVLAMVYEEFPVNGINTDPGIRIKDVPELG